MWQPRRKSRLGNTLALASLHEACGALPESTKKELAVVPVGELGKPGLHIFTDGSAELDSAGNQSAGWGLAMLRQREHHVEFLGFACGPVVLHGHGAIGAQRSTNNTAEISAMAWAFLLLDTCTKSEQATLHYDSEHAAGAVLAEQRLTTNVQLVYNTRALRWRCQKLHELEFSKVLAHSEHPWNDMADAAAAWGRQGNKRGTEAVVLRDMQQLLHAYDRRLDCQPKVCKHWPMAHEGWEYHHDQWHLPVHVIFADAVAKPKQKHKTQQSSEACTWRFASANVLTLHFAEAKTEVGLMVTARMAWLQQCFAKHDVHFVGIQEARTPEGVRNMSEYFSVSGGAARGMHGCELWVSKESGIKQTEVVASSASSRHLLCAVRSKNLRLDILVAHAPYAKFGMEEVEAWWNELGAVVRARRSPAPLVCLVDANAKVGSVMSSAVGDRSPEEQNETGQVFHSYLLEHDMCLPSTFGDTPCISEHTWTAPAGTRHRCDYVAVPQQWIGHVQKAEVLADVDLAMAREDHRPVLVEVKMPKCDHGEMLCDRRPLKLDRQLMACPSRRRMFEDMLAQEPDVPHDVGVDTHHYLLVKQMRELAKKFFTTSHTKPRKPWVGEETWSHMQHAKLIRESLAECANCIRLVLQRHVFDAWHGLAFIDPSRTWSRKCMEAETAQLLCNRAVLWQQLDRVCRMRAKSARADKRRYVTCVAERAQSAAARGDNKELYNCVKSLKPKKPGAGVTIRMEDGTCAATPQEARQRWQDHFVQLLRADVTTFAELAEEQWKLRDSLHIKSAIELLPSPDHVTDIIATCKNGKAVGEDCLPAELLRAAPQQVLRLLYPLLQKIFMWVHVPLKWKGGVWQELYKGKGSPALCKSYRGVVLEDHMAKIPAKICRKALMPDFEQYALDEQVW